MAEPIGPGDWVEFIGEDDGAAPFPGKIYRVAYFVAAIPCFDCGDAGRGVELEGTSHFGNGRGFCPGCELRPIYRPRASFIESLKAPPKRAPKRQREAA